MIRVLAIDQELLSWLAPILKLVLTACIVVTASVIVERSGPLIGALVVTLPVTVWPAYLFLSLEHNASYLADSAGVGLAVNAVSGAFLLLYLVLAQKRNLALSLGVAVGAWIVLAGLVYSSTWTVLGAGMLNLLVYPLCLALCNRYRAVRVPLLVRQWYELPVRTATVCIMMAGVLLLSRWGGPRAAGLLAVFPISTTCTILILHPRIGGPASAAVIANGLWGLFGIGLGLFALASTVLTWGLPLALGLALAIPVAWNLSVWRIHRRLGR